MSAIDTTALEAELAELRRTIARGAELAHELEAALREFGDLKRLELGAQLHISLAAGALVNLLCGPGPRVAAVGRIGPGLHVVRNEPPEAA